MKQPVMFAFFSNQSDYIDQKTENRTDMKIMYITIKQKAVYIDLSSLSSRYI